MLEVLGLSAGYLGQDVVLDATLGVDDGEVVAIVGSNGAGKTTLFRAICGLLAVARQRALQRSSDHEGGGAPDCPPRPVLRARRAAPLSVDDGPRQPRSGRIRSVPTTDALPRSSSSFPFSPSVSINAPER